MNPYDDADDEPTAEARWHANELEYLYSRYRDLAGLLLSAAKALESHGAAQPFIRTTRSVLIDHITGERTAMDHEDSVSPDEIIDALERILAADYRKCREENEREYDRVSASQAQQRASEMRGGK